MATEITRAVETEPESSGNGISGYGLVTGQWTEMQGMFGVRIFERVSETAIDLQRDMSAPTGLFSFLNHDPNQLLGRTRAGTLEVTAEDDGVRYTIPKLPDLEHAERLHAHLERGEVRGSSFMAYLDDDEIAYNEDDDAVYRTITSLTLRELGPVVMPAHSKTEDGPYRVKTRDLEEAVARCAGVPLAEVRRTTDDGCGLRSLLTEKKYTPVTHHRDRAKWAIRKRRHGHDPRGAARRT
jgi:HK97 family phage prohead protease